MGAASSGEDWRELNQIEFTRVDKRVSAIDTRAKLQTYVLPIPGLRQFFQTGTSSSKIMSKSVPNI
jgi:hypothetical protein